MIDQDPTPPRVLLTFLGRGRQSNDGQRYEYHRTKYRYGDREHESQFVQVALVSLLAHRGKPFDRVIVANTVDSFRDHWEALARELANVTENTHGNAAAQGSVLHSLRIDDDLDVTKQWNNFAAILHEIPANCELHVDLTHGFRAIPIMFSLAIELLTQIKGVRLSGVYYGAFDKRDSNKVTPILEMSRFFEVTRWADAVRSVIDDANPALLAKIAEDSSLPTSALASPSLVDALEQLASVIKNAQSEQAASACNQAIEEIQKARANASPIEQALLDLLHQKFSGLARAQSDQRFTKDWYHTQLALAETMLDHGLFMQGLTVLQELMISCCEERVSHALCSVSNAARDEYLQHHSWKKFEQKYNNHRRSLGTALLNRLRLGHENWQPKTSYDPEGTFVQSVVQEQLDALRGSAFEESAELREMLKELGSLRNAFDHAWVGREQAMTPEDIRERSKKLIDDGKHRIKVMLEIQLIGRGEPTMQRPNGGAPTP
jgi:CRISPR-associated Csx2 family protein